MTTKIFSYVSLIFSLLFLFLFWKMSKVKHELYQKPNTTLFNYALGEQNWIWVKSLEMVLLA
jgi:hypothetical protein